MSRLVPGGQQLDVSQRLFVAVAARALLRGFVAAGRQHPPGGRFGLWLSRIGAAIRAETGAIVPGKLKTFLLATGVFNVSDEWQSCSVATFRAAGGGLPNTLYAMDPEAAFECILRGDNLAAPAAAAVAQARPAVAAPAAPAPSVLFSFGQDAPPPVAAAAAAAVAVAATTGSGDRVGAGDCAGDEVGGGVSGGGGGEGDDAVLEAGSAPTALAVGAPLPDPTSPAPTLAAATSVLPSPAVASPPPPVPPAAFALAPPAQPQPPQPPATPTPAPGAASRARPELQTAPGTLRLTFGPDGRARVALVGTAAAAELASRQADTGSGARMAAACGGGGGCDSDDHWEGFLQLLLQGLRAEVRRCIDQSPPAADAAGAGPSSAPSPSSPSVSFPAPLLSDLVVDAGRDVRLVFADGSKCTLAGVRVSIPAALAQLQARLRCLLLAEEEQPPGDASVGGGAWAAAAASSAVAGAGAMVGATEALEEGARGGERKRSWGDGGAETAVEGGAGGDEAAWPAPLTDTGPCPTGAKRLRLDGDALAAAQPPPPPPSHPWSLFGTDNRCCLPGSLHRVSALLDPRQEGRVLGLTYRVGRHLPGVAGALADVLADLAGGGRGGRRGGGPAGAGTREDEGAQQLTGSLLLLGRPGCGKTTLLRDIAARLSAPAPAGLGLEVMVVDTSNEIAGGDAVPHACIGSARRLIVGPRHRLAEVMVEAVQNHGPEVVVVDEIANAKEAEAARTIAARGVVLVATAHGTGLRSLMDNPQLNALVGGLHTVTLGDMTAHKANHGHKTRTERRGKPVFRTLVEVLGGGRLLLRPDVAASVDALVGTSSPQGSAPLHWQQPQPQQPLLAKTHVTGPVHGPGVGTAPGRMPRQQPGSLVLVYSDAAAAGRAGGRVDEALPPLEQLRWTEARGGASGGGDGAAGGRGGAVGGQTMVRLLSLGADAELHLVAAELGTRYDQLDDVEAMLARLISHSQLLSVAGAEGGGIQAGYALLSELTALLLELESAILRLPARIGDDLRCKPALDELQVLLSKVVQYRAECEDTSRHLEAALSELVQATSAPAPHCSSGCSNEPACSPSSLPALESAQPDSLTSAQDQAQGQSPDRDQECDVLLRVRRVICSLALDVEVGAQAQHGGLDAELLALREAMRREMDLDLDLDLEVDLHLEVEVGRHEEALAATATTASGVGLQQQQSREEEEPQPEAPARVAASADCPMAEPLAWEGEVGGPGCSALVRRGSRRARDWAPGGPTGPAGPEAPLGPHWALQGLGRVERLHAARHVSRRLAAQHLTRLKQQREQQQGQGMQQGQALGGQQLQLQSHPLASATGSRSSAAAQEPQSQQAGRVPVPVPVAGAGAQLGGAEGRADGDEPPAVRQRRGEVVGADVRSHASSRSHTAAVMVASSSDAHATADVEGDRSADSSSDITWGGLRVSGVKPAPQTPVGETVRVSLPGPLGAWPAPHPHAQNPVPSPSPSPRPGHGQGNPWPATPSSPDGPTAGHTPASVAALRKLNRVTRLAGMWEAGGPLAAVPDGAASPSGDDGYGDDGSCSVGSEASTSGRLSDGEDAVRRAAGPRRRRTAGEQPHVPASPPPLPLPPAPPQLRQPQPELVPMPGFVAKAAAPHGGAALSPFLMLAMQGRAPKAPPPPVLGRIMACPVEASCDGAGAGRKQGAGEEEELPAAPAAAAAGASLGVSPYAAEAAEAGHRRAAPFAVAAPAPLPLPNASVHLRAVGLPGWALPYAPHHWPPAGPLGPPGGFGPGFGLPHPHPHAPSGPDAPSPSPCNPLDLGLGLDLGLDLGPHVPSLDLHRDVTAWGPCLGRGAFGAVYKALYRNRPVAVKVLHGGGLDSGDLRSLAAEIRLLAQPRLRDHPHVIQVLGAAAAPPDHFALVTELMDCDLYDYIHRRRQNCVPLDEVLHIARSIAAGLAGLHPGIVHRDLKPANVLLRHTPAAAAGPGGAARLVVKIADFGLARYKRSTYLSTRHRDAGTLKYMAPEAMQAGGSRGAGGGGGSRGADGVAEGGNGGGSGGVTEKCDIYSFGVLLYELITGREPWEGYHPLFAVCQVQSGATLPLPDDPARCPPALRTLVLRCWAAQHAARPSAAEAVAALDDMIAQLARHDGGGGGAPEVVAAVAAAAAGSLQA
ncbi:hypothetical protein HYH03_010007 [Edaphochlamys debaryana]|uniref:Protein kinase domain-containing protein n=1 Tax=Edaphochlamys debaryana TaxID=47281 RepID=A0A836BWE4_9CHLO|nr:hypothetical protein HYH03_010007 [Edaphochlamys debaryana]|eukprot:KAG2491636.1 hypothetical protein HYH03_010007 [Edaphochlamys debaryana]